MIAILGIGGCALDPDHPRAGSDSRSVSAPGAVSALEAERAQARLAPGKSSKAEVLSVLGKAAAVVAFDSGYEVWVYRIRSPDEKAKQGVRELVLLFEPSGRLAKSRVRLPTADSAPPPAGRDKG